MNVERSFFLLIFMKKKKKKDRQGKEGRKKTKTKKTTFMGNTITPTISAARKDKCEGMVVESELL